MAYAHRCRRGDAKRNHERQRREIQRDLVRRHEQRAERPHQESHGVERADFKKLLDADRESESEHPPQRVAREDRRIDRREMRPQLFPRQR